MAEKSYYKYIVENFEATETDPQDAFNDPNSPILNLYSTGDGFSIHDNSALYEVIKVFKDTIDRQPTYFQSVNYAIDVNNKRLILNVTTQNDHLSVLDTLENLIEHVRTELEQYYGDTFDIAIEKRDIMGKVATDMGVEDSSGKMEYKIFVSEKQKDPPKNVE